MEPKDLLSLAEKLEAVEKELSRMKSVQAIQNLMGRYTTNHSQKNMHKTVEFYALDRPDVSVEIADLGIYVGAEAIKTLFQKQYFIPQLEGNLLIHYLSTPMIEVAKDGQTAKGVWRSPGIEAVVPAGGGEPVPLWCYGAYAIDFILVAGEWKVWHMHWFTTVKCKFRDGWVKDLSYVRSKPNPNAPAGLLPTTYHNPYTPDSIQESIPPCPAPYDTWQDDAWMTGGQK
jgi:hypothetical protein